MPRKDNGANEAKGIGIVVTELNTEGHHKRVSLENMRGKCVTNVQKCGGMSTPYDILIEFEDGEKVHVEVKTSKKNIPQARLSRDDPPWKETVQFTQFPANKFPLGNLYKDKWYTDLIESNIINEKLNITETIPDREFWTNTTAYALTSGKASKCAWTKELYDSLKRRELLKMKKGFTVTFKNSIDDQVLQDMIPVFQDALTIKWESKDMWLRQTQGGASYIWYEQVKVPVISRLVFKDYTKRGKHLSDVEIICELSEEHPFFKKSPPIVKLRWGHGVGITNLRIDFSGGC